MTVFLFINTLTKPILIVAPTLISVWFGIRYKRESKCKSFFKTFFEKYFLKGHRVTFSPKIWPDLCINR